MNNKKAIKELKPETPETPETPAIPEKPSVETDSTEDAVTVGTGSLKDDSVMVGSWNSSRTGSASQFNKRKKSYSGSAFSNLKLYEPLDNIVLGLELEEKDGKVVPNSELYRYAGKHPKFGHESLQDVNKTNVLVAAETEKTDEQKALDRGLFLATNLHQDQKWDVVGYEGDKGNDRSTRVFGNKYLDSDNKAPFNSYVGVVNADDKYTFGDGTEVAYKSYDVAMQKLNHVQYGRVSNEIDAFTDSTRPANKDGYAKFVKYSDAKAVQTYFYRGTDATTIANMKSLEKEAPIDYLGHAITYGLSHKPKLGNAPVGLPNSFGDTEEDTLIAGSFVKATFDPKAKKVSGKIYDTVINKTFDNLTHKVVASASENDLIKFKDVAVKGNSFYGKATSEQKKGQVAVIRGSFFGKDAAEMGGNVNSVAKDYQKDKNWGAVFGAKKVIKPTTPKPEKPDTGVNKPLFSHDGISVDKGNTDANWGE